MRCLEPLEVSSWLPNRGRISVPLATVADAALANGQRALRHASWHTALPSVTRPLCTAFQVQSPDDQLRENWSKHLKVEQARKFSTCIKDVCNRDRENQTCIVSKNSGNTAGGQVKQENVVVWFLCGPNHKKDDYHCEKDKDHFHVNFTTEHYPQIQFKCAKDAHWNVGLRWQRARKAGEESHFEFAPRESGENKDCCNSEYVREDYPLAERLVSRCLDELPKPKMPKKK